MNFKLRKEATRDEQVGFHYREIEIDGTVYQLEYCSGPSLLSSGRTDQLYMQITVLPEMGKDIELYTLKRYPVSSQDAIVEHIVVNKRTRETRLASDRNSLDNLLRALDENGRDELMNSFPSFPSDFRESVKPFSLPVSDWDLMRMYFKHL